MNFSVVGVRYSFVRNFSLSDSAGRWRSVDAVKLIYENPIPHRVSTLSIQAVDRPGNRAVVPTISGTCCWPCRKCLHPSVLEMRRPRAAAWEPGWARLSSRRAPKTGSRVVGRSCQLLQQQRRQQQQLLTAHKFWARHPRGRRPEWLARQCRWQKQQQQWKQHCWPCWNELCWLTVLLWTFGEVSSTVRATGWVTLV